MDETKSKDETLNPYRASRTWRRAMPFWVQVLVLLGVFASGLCVGAAGMSNHILGRMRHYRESPELFPSEITVSLTGQLGLSEQQASKVRQHIAKRHARITEIREQSAPQILREFAKMEREVASELDAKQQKLWKEKVDWARDTFLPVLPETAPHPSIR